MFSKKLVIIFAIFCLTFSIFYFFSLKTEASGTVVTVARVIDGDTFKLANGKEVRLIGIDSPEKGQYYYQESKNKLKQLVEGKSVKLERDVSNIDNRNRLLRYVFVDDKFVNLELVEQGYANAYLVHPDTKYLEKFMEAESMARKNRVGIWKSYSVYSGCVEIVNFHYNTKGNDNENLNDEYVVFKNDCDFSINMTNWSVKDSATNVYHFPEFVLSSKATVKLLSGSGKDSSSELYWNSNKAIWDNSGDTLFLRDTEGNLVLTRSYSSKFDVKK